jgi:hypothetical protein
MIAQLVGRRNALVKSQIALKNQLHLQLSFHYPSYKKFFSKVDGQNRFSFLGTLSFSQTSEGRNRRKFTNIPINS